MRPGARRAFESTRHLVSLKRSASDSFSASLVGFLTEGSGTSLIGVESVHTQTLRIIDNASGVTCGPVRTFKSHQSSREPQIKAGFCLWAALRSLAHWKSRVPGQVPCLVSTPLDHSWHCVSSAHRELHGLNLSEREMMSSDTCDQRLTLRLGFREHGAAKSWVSRFAVSSIIRMITGLSEGTENHLSVKGWMGVLRDMLRAKLSRVWPSVTSSVLSKVGRAGRPTE